MKDLLKVWCVTIVLAFGISEAFGQFVWTKDARNPILSGGALGTWNRHIFQPCVLFNTDSLRYEMWFGASPGPPWRPYRIGFAVSKDGITWTMNPTPVLSPDPGTWEASTVESPMVIRENKQYKMWYTGSPDLNLTMIGYATSPDGIHWTKYSGNPVMGVGKAAWEAGGPYSCSVMPFGSGYRMWYGAFEAPPSAVARIGYATSADGITWQRDTVNNPVVATGTAGQWDAGWVLSPTVLQIGDTHFMWYIGAADFGSNSTRYGGVATSKDTGKTWTKYAANPVLQPSAGKWDGTVIEGGTVMRRGDTLDMWYAGAVEPTGTYLWRIGHATSPLLGVRHRVPQDYATIQAAINASVNGDTVLVAEGTYKENIRFRGKAIVVGSLYLTDGDTTHISRTVIDGSNPSNPDSGSVVSFLGGEDTTSVLCGFTITGGTGTLFSEPAGTGRFGGGIYCRRGARICHNNIVHNSVAHPDIAAGGGIECFPEVSGPTMTIALILEHNTIAYNSATSTAGWVYGGGIDAGGYEDTTRYVIGRVVDNAITDNSISTQATGAYAYGGGFVTYTSAFLVERNLIARNTVSAPNCITDPSYGGGFDADASFLTLVLRNNTIVNNLVQTSTSQPALGGGVALMTWDSESDIVASGNLIALNSTIGNTLLTAGGGFYVQDGNPRLENNIVAKNTAATGGGVGFSRNDTTITAALPMMINNTIAFNRATSGQGAGILSRGSWSPIVINSIAWGDTGTHEVELLDGSNIDVLYSDIEGGWPGTGNMNVDPLFVAGDPLYNLSASSACISHGIDSIQIAGVWYPVPVSDYSGRTRPRPFGTHPDMGAQEEQSVVVAVADRGELPSSFGLEQNYPNPFNPTTVVKYQLPVVSEVKLVVFDILGREVTVLVNEKKAPGSYEVTFNGSHLASGVYFYRLEAGNFVQTCRMLLIK